LAAVAFGVAARRGKIVMLLVAAGLSATAAVHNVLRLRRRS